MQYMRLSIIIPVYQVETTLDRCVSSVMAQAVSDMEVIIVDDGSTDNSPRLCDQWAQRDARIHVLHKRNGGLSDARNAGIRMATGQYITFVDSDDYLELDTYQPLLSLLAEHPDFDIVEYPAKLFDGSDKEQFLSFANNTYLSASSYWNETAAYQHAYACNKIFKKELFKNINFPVGRVFEDIYTLPLLLKQAHKVATSANGCYHYCYNPHGITTMSGAESWRMLLEAHINILNMPFFQSRTDDYLKHLLNIELFTYELTNDDTIIQKIHFQHPDDIKSLINNFIGTRLLCKVNRIFRQIVVRRS